ncbi:MAG: hypothetical protein ABEJ56_01815 [Candidatus Nanohaloarchaea archaeon]
MENELNTLEQATPFGCFMNCYGMIKSYYDEDFEFDKDKELELMERSFRFDRECYEPYLISELMKEHSVNVFIESDYLVWKYQKLSETLENNIEPKHEILSADNYIESVETGFAIVLLDKWNLDMYTHFAHWVVLSDYQNGKFTVNDSWTGREIQIPKSRFMDSIENLRDTLNCSPILISIKSS